MPPIAHLGEICALLAPFAWSVAVILFKRSDGAPAASLNLFKNSFALVLLTVTLAGMGVGVPLDRPVGDWLRLFGSALLGLALADTLLFEALRRIGAGRLAVVETVYAPVVVLTSWLLLGEVPTAPFLGGAAAVVCGIALATVQRGALSAGQRGHWIGTLYGVAAISLSGLGVVLVKPVLERSHLFEVTWTRLCIGLVGQLLWIALRGSWREAGAAFRPSRLWRTLVPASFVGTYLSLVLWLGGYKWADASVAAVLNQMATVYTLVLAWAVLRERLRPAQIAGALLAAGGALWILLTRMSP
jgi:drug/metabolite transporter (DMT)-like permease